MRIRLTPLWILGFALAILGSCINIAHAGDVKLDWTPPLTCADGSALVNCPTTGYEVGQGATLTGQYTAKETVAANVISRSYLGLTPGKYCYLVKTVSNADKSAESNHVCADVPSIPPKAPQGLTVTVTVSIGPTLPPPPP